MQLVVDANVLFAVIIGRGKTLRLFFSDKLEFLAPAFLFEEIDNNKPLISKLSGISDEKIDLLLSRIKARIRVVYPDEVKAFKEEALRLCPHPKDSAYFTVALAFKAAIWSREKEFKKQDKIEVFTTVELIDMFDIK